MSPRPSPIIIPGPSGMGSNMQQQSSQVNLTAFVKLLDATLGQHMRNKKATAAADVLAPSVLSGISPEGQKTVARSAAGRKTIFDMIQDQAKEGVDSPFPTPRMYQDKEGKYGKKGAYRWGFFSKDAVPKMIKDTRLATKKELEHAAAININMGKPPAAAERTALAEGAASIDALNNLNSLYKKTFVGPVAGRAGKARNVFGLNPEQQSNFLAATAAFRNSIIKQITGAQMSEPEAKRILKQIPDETDPPTVWKAKWQQSKKNIEMMQKRRKQVLKESGLKVPTMDIGKQSEGKKPLSSFERQ